MENYCISCGMHLQNEEDIAAKHEKGFLCKFCVNEEGNPKSCQEVFEGGVHFFMNSVSDIDRDLAERITRKNMKSLPLWQGVDEDCLKGETATEEEFKSALDKLNQEIEAGNIEM